MPSASITGSKLVRFVYESSEPHLRLIWEWEARAANGPIEHRIRIQNLSGRELWLPLQESFQFDFKAAPEETLKQFWVEKGASSPSPDGFHFVAVGKGYQWTGTSSTYAHPPKGAPREMIPYLLVERPEAGEAGCTWESSSAGGPVWGCAARAIPSKDGQAWNPDPGPYKTRLPAGGTYETPTCISGRIQRRARWCGQQFAALDSRDAE